MDEAKLVVRLIGGEQTAAPVARLQTTRPGCCQNGIIAAAQQRRNAISESVVQAQVRNFRPRSVAALLRLPLPRRPAGRSTLALGEWNLHVIKAHLNCLGQQPRDGPRSAAVYRPQRGTHQHQPGLRCLTTFSLGPAAAFRFASLRRAAFATLRVATASARG
jgi:hypothetical protein